MFGLMRGERTEGNYEYVENIFRAIIVISIKCFSL